ncbi:MAG: hypothetical protein WCP98_04280 [Actinomycetes bacterium]
MSDDIVDCDPQDYPEAVTWAKERAKELRRQSKQITILNTTVANLHSHIAELEAELSAKSQSESELTDELAALKAECSAPWYVGAFIDVDGFKVGPHMVREYREELAALKAQLAVADEMDAALEWLDNGYVVRATDKLERLDTTQRVYREMRAARGKARP